jgi:hypothetical protein
MSDGTLDFIEATVSVAYDRRVNVKRQSRVLGYSQCGYFMRKLYESVKCILGWQVSKDPMVRVKKNIVVKFNN